MYIDDNKTKNKPLVARPIFERHARKKTKECKEKYIRKPSLESGIFFYPF